MSEDGARGKDWLRARGMACVLQTQCSSSHNALHSKAWKPCVYSANARKEGYLNVHSVDLVISVGTLSGRFAPETFVPGRFAPNEQNARHLMIRLIIPDISSHIFLQAPLYET